MSLDNIQLTKEIFIAIDIVSNGDGTKDKPFKAPGGHLDGFVSQFGNSIKVNLFPGHYVTRGFRVPENFILEGLGAHKEDTVIRLIGNVGDTNFNYPHIRMFAEKTWSNLFVIKNLTLDGNWQNQVMAGINGNYKIDLVVVRCTQGKAENIKIINFGANGKNYGMEGLEAFPLCFNTFSNGPPYKYHPQYLPVNQREPQTYVEVSDCEVSNGNFLNGGYCTAIFVRTNQPDGGDRQVVGVRESPAAVIKNNVVSCGDGIAYGCGVAEMVKFENNKSISSKCGLNIDTGVINRIQITRNQFLDCNQGINIVPVIGSKNVIIKNNVITLTAPYFNKILKRYEPFYGINIKNVTETSIKNNYILGLNPQYKKNKAIVGFNEPGNVLVNLS